MRLPGFPQAYGPLARPVHGMEVETSGTLFRWVRGQEDPVGTPVMVDLPKLSLEDRLELARVMVREAEAMWRKAAGLP